MKKTEFGFANAELLQVLAPKVRACRVSRADRMATICLLVPHDRALEVPPFSFSNQCERLLLNAGESLVSDGVLVGLSKLPLGVSFSLLAVSAHRLILYTRTACSSVWEDQVEVLMEDPMRCRRIWESLRSFLASPELQSIELFGRSLVQVTLLELADGMRVAEISKSDHLRHHTLQIGWWIYGHCDTSLRRDAVAALFGLSGRQLNERIQRHWGMSYSKMVRNGRLLRAIAMLRDSTSSCGEIAAAAGFGGPEQMNYCFRERYGFSPRAYRKAIKGRIDVLQDRQLSVLPQVSARDFYDFRELPTVEHYVNIHICNLSTGPAEISWLNHAKSLQLLTVLPSKCIDAIHAYPNHRIHIRTGEQEDRYIVGYDDAQILVSNTSVDD